MNVNRVRAITLWAAIGFGFVACGSSSVELDTAAEQEPSTDTGEAETPADVTDASEAEIPPPHSNDFEAPAVTPPVGEEVAVVLHISEDCRNGGRLDGFGVGWGVLDHFSISGDWRGQSVDGVLRFESWEMSTFEIDEVSVRVTHSLDLVDECLDWG